MEVFFFPDTQSDKLFSRSSRKVPRHACLPFALSFLFHAALLLAFMRPLSAGNCWQLTRLQLRAQQLLRVESTSSIIFDIPHALKLRNTRALRVALIRSCSHMRDEDEK